MKRNVDELGSETFDLLVVGGGSHGACIARDGSLRGLSVALIDKGDFCSGTSHNSLKIVHSGIRYLQHLDIKRIRESISELKIWLSIAPHLIRPLQFAIPTQGYLTRGPMALQAGLLLHKLIGSGLGAKQTAGIPIGRVHMKSSLADYFPGLPLDGLTGVATWHDGQMLDADRIVLECLQTAVANRAVVANYVSANGLLQSGNTVHGVSAFDEIGNTEIEIKARTTIIAGGPWTEEILRRSMGNEAESVVPPLARNMNIVTRQLFSDYGVGIPSRRSSDAIIGSQSRLFFVTPWKNVSAIGTTHFPYEGAPRDYKVSEHEIDEFVAEVNDSYPPAQLKIGDVLYVYSGLTPAEPEDVRGEVGRSKQSEIIDHSKYGDLDGLISVIGVKYTTARLIGERAVTMAQEKLRTERGPFRTRTERLPGAQNAETGNLPPASIEAGDGISDILAPYGSKPPGGLAQDSKLYSDVFADCIRHAVRHEMAMTLDDVLIRRTDLVERGLMTEEFVYLAAKLMAEEFNWSQRDTQLKCDEMLSKIRYLSKAVN